MTKFLTLLMAGTIAVWATSSAIAESLSVTKLVVKQNLKAGKPYNVAFRFTGDASRVSKVCFLWSGEGPYCWDEFRVDTRAGLIRTKAFTGNPNRYHLTGYVVYGGGKKSRTVGARINVTK